MFVKTLFLKNFKSFKSARVEFEPGFNCIVGPNGSGKSNIVDAILFAVGENSMKSLRAKRISDLIFTNAKVGEVELELGGEEKHGVSRAVRNDGKTKYRLDGKRTKRYVIEDFLSQNALSKAHVIQQGSVQRIVEMNGKERRALVDEIANVSEYEGKKAEAFRELERAEEKLREARAVLSERRGYLEELEKEKEDAQKYLGLQEALKRAKATLISIDLVALEKEFEVGINNLVDLQSKLDIVRNSIDEVVRQIDSLVQEKNLVNQEIMLRSEGKQAQLQKEISELENAIELARALIAERKENIKKASSRDNELRSSVQRALDELKGVNARVSEQSGELQAMQKRLHDEETALQKLESASSAFSKDFFSAKEEVEKTNSEMQACRDSLSELQVKGKTLEETIALKERELQRLSQGDKRSDFAEVKKAVAEQLTVLRKEFKEHEVSAQKLFDRERDLNEKLPVLEDLILNAREKSVEISSRLRHLDAEPSKTMELLAELREREKGIHGTLEELCNYDSQYSVPIQVALGNRLSFVVVDSSVVAGKVIEELKARKAGRMSFIPLDKIRAPELNEEERKLSESGSCVSPIIELLKFDRKFEKAFKFACSNTLLMASFKDAEKSVGRARMVTAQGELFEPHGLITGGSLAQRINVFRERKELEEWEKKHESARVGKESVLGELRSIREELHEARRKKAEVELRQKSLELELQHAVEQERREDEAFKNVSGARKELSDEISKMRSELDLAGSERSSLVRKLSDINLRHLAAKEKIDFEKEKNLGIAVKEREKRVGELKVAISEVQSQLTSLEAQKQLFEREANGLQKDLDSLVSEVKAAENTIKECDSGIKEKSSVLREKLEEQKRISSAFSELAEKREALEAKIESLGNKKGKLEFEREKLDKEMGEQSVRKAVAEARLADLRASFSEFVGVELLEEKNKAVLGQKVQELEVQITGIGSVNLRAIELFEQRQKEFEEQKSTVENLATEKQAVIALINEIEGKKIATFMEAFNAVNDYFKSLFSKVFKGVGELVLENYENPFEGGLTIKAQLENKEVKYLELMSGGEKSLIALMFIFSLQLFSPASAYVLDEADAALDAENSRKLADLIKQLSGKSQFIVVSHNQGVYREANCLVGVSMTKQGSQLVEVKLDEKASVTGTRG
jgi:chromosome segregation protein